MVGHLKQDRWTSPEGQARSKVLIVAEHVEFKPQLKKQDGDGKDGEAGAAEAEGKSGDESAAETQSQEETELKEATSF